MIVPGQFRRFSQFAPQRDSEPAEPDDDHIANSRDVCIKTDSNDQSSLQNMIERMTSDSRVTSIPTNGAAKPPAPPGKLPNVFGMVIALL
jgi:hypothetical protein